MALTKHPPGSVRELWAIAFPLMLGSFCLLMMLFVDRVFLAHFSGEAMNAALTAGTAAWAVAGSFLIIGAMAEVFVAQHNGAKEYHKLGKPVWQMIWFSLGSIALLLPIGIWGGPLLFRGSSNMALENEAFFWYLAVGFSWPLLAAVSAFFVGRGKTQLILWMSLFANVINVFLDWLLIFGVEGWWEPMGIKGAAIATNMGNLIQIAILLTFFLRAKNRRTFGTGQWRFDFSLFKRCLRVGVPQAVLFFIEILGFTFFYMMIGHLGPDEMFVAGACQSVCILFFFASEGVSRGAIAVAGNYMGAGDPKQSFRVFWSGVKIHIGFFLFISLFLVAFPGLLMDLFVNPSLSLEASGVERSPELLNAMRTTLQGGLILCLIYLLFDGIRWLISGILTAAGDTLFILIFGVISVPLFLLLPTYWIVERLHYGTIAAFGIASFFVGTLGLIFGIRLWSGRWAKLNLVRTQSQDTASESEVLPLS